MVIVLANYPHLVHIRPSFHINNSSENLFYCCSFLKNVGIVMKLYNNNFYYCYYVLPKISEGTPLPKIDVKRTNLT